MAKSPKPLSKRNARSNRSRVMPEKPVDQLFRTDAESVSAFETEYSERRAFSQRKIVEENSEFFLTFAVNNPQFTSTEIAEFFIQNFKGKGILSREFKRALVKLLDEQRNSTADVVVPFIHSDSITDLKGNDLQGIVNISDQKSRYNKEAPIINLSLIHI